MTNPFFQATKSTIIVVDDNPDLVALLWARLEQREFNVMCAHSGPELFTSLEEQKPDLIILDIMMTQMDGLEVLTRLKGDPSTASIPVILLTAKVQHEDVILGYKKGAANYITKPFTNGQLLDAIKSILS